MKDPRTHARKIFMAAVEAVNAENCLERHLHRTGTALCAGDHSFDLAEFENIYIIGAGKATAHMAKAAESMLSDRITSGLIVVKYGHAVPLKTINTIEAGHPVPDDNGRRGAARIMDIAEAAGKKDLVLCLISGGGSALLPLPAPGLTLEEKQDTIRNLLACGAGITEINTIRKHLSAIKGGQLARAACPAVLLTLMISDVVGDKPDVIASGPTVEDTSTFGDCLQIIEKYRLETQLPETVIRRLKRGEAGREQETPKPGELSDSCLYNLTAGSNYAALLRAASHAQALGYNTLILSSIIEGDTTECALFHAAIARQAAETGHPVNPPACIISGGETTVRIRGNGLGGRSQEFCLAAAMQIDGCGNIVILCGGTDGTDGPTDAAGAAVDSASLRRAASMGLDAAGYLENNDSYGFFSQTGELLVTGPTGTNVMDVRIMIIT